MCMCVSMCVRTYVCVCSCICVSVHTCVYVCMYMCECTLFDLLRKAKLPIDFIVIVHFFSM